MSGKKTVIIGAGPAGLTCAYELTKDENREVTILEEENFFGGISRTADFGGNRTDIGGHRFFSKDERVVALWKELMPVQGEPSFDDKLLGREKPLESGGPDPEKSDDVMLIRGRVSRIMYLHKFFDYPVSMKPQTFINMGFFRTMKAGLGYIGSCIKKRPETNLENFYINRFGKPLYEMFFEGYTEKLWGVHPRDISAEWGAQRVKGLSVSKAIKNAFGKIFNRKGKEVETSLIEQFYYPKKGPGQLYEKMAEIVTERGGGIKRGEKVVKITAENGKIISVTTKNADGEERTYRGDYFVSSMPVKDLIEAIGKENVPEEVYETAVALPYRDFMTVALLADKLKVRNKTKIKTLGNIVPDCWIYVQEREVKLGRIQIFNNWSPYMVADPENTVYLGLEYFCAEGDEIWNMPDEKFIKFATDELVKIGVIGSGENVLGGNVVRVKKAYPAYFGSYKNFGKVREYLDGFENLFCVGRNGQHRYNNMDHSMCTAMLAAEQIKSGVIDKNAVWNVNTEKSYHEAKSNG